MLFGAFVLAILATVGVNVVVWHTFGDRSWSEEMAALERFAVARLDAAWDDPDTRRDLLTDVERELGVRVALDDASGAALVEAPACDGQSKTVAVPGRGSARVCLPHGRPPGRLFLALGLAGAVLFALSGFVARRLAAPLRQVARVAERLGEGELDARVGAQRWGDSEVAVLAQTIDTMAERIETQLREQRELLAAVSHELRTPLGHVRVLLDLARDAPGAEDRARQHDEIERELVEMDDLVGKLLARSRLEFGRVEPRPVDAVDLAARSLERKGLPATLLDAPASLAVEADATLLARALANLVDNAEKHGGGLRRLAVERTPEGAAFLVEDAGPGFDESAFAPFAGRDEARAGGLGLGLHLARRIARAHGGDVEVRPGQPGARVRLTVGPVPEGRAARVASVAAPRPMH
ncbi:MAG: HAMP domain-containing sensor histidine kinase [Myxococcota bacterium]